MLPNLTVSPRRLRHRTSSFTSFLSSLSSASSSSTSSPTLPLHQVLRHSSLTYNNITYSQFQNPSPVPPPRRLESFLRIQPLALASSRYANAMHFEFFYLFSNYFLFMHFLLICFQICRTISAATLDTTRM